jgi:hypothetical protein
MLPDEDVLPVLPALRDLLPAGGLQRGSVVAAGAWSMLCLALAAGASGAGAWCAVTGLPQLGVAAAADAGLDPGRLLLIAEPGSSWPQVVASLLDGCEIVILCPPDRAACCPSGVDGHWRWTRAAECPPGAGGGERARRVVTTSGAVAVAACPRWLDHRR